VKDIVRHLCGFFGAALLFVSTWLDEPGRSRVLWLKLLALGMASALILLALILLGVAIERAMR
jgi:hypothetical protein